MDCKLHKEVKQFFTDRGYPTEIRDGRQTGFFTGRVTGSAWRFTNIRVSRKHFSKSGRC